MRQLLIALALAVVLAGSAWATPAGTCKSGAGGIPQTINATNSAGGTALLCANPLRVSLFCENTGTANNVWISFGQDPTATNSFLLVPNGGYISFPIGGCNSRPQSGGIGTGCVPTAQINALGAASGTNTTVCWED